MSGHGVGQRPKVRGYGTVAIKGASSVNRFVYRRKRQSVSHHITLSCHVATGANVREFNGNGMMMKEMKCSSTYLL